MLKVWYGIQHSPAWLRVVIFLLATVVVAAPLFVPLYQFEYAATQGKTVTWAPIALFSVWVLLLPLWLRLVHQRSRPWQVLGMHRPRAWGSAWLVAFGAGGLAVGLLYGLQLLLGWSAWVGPGPANWPYNLLEGLLVGIGVGLAEELIFRGWMLFEFEQNYSPAVALGLDAGIFAIAHYLRPLSEIWATWPQFLGLLLLGLALVWARRIPVTPVRLRHPGTTLGPAAGLHGGLVFAYYQFDVNDLVSATNRVPEWMTGVGGNPLAGLLGLSLLGAIAYVTYTLSHPTKRMR